MRKLTVAYKDSMRILLKAPGSSSASHMFVSVGIPTCSAVRRNLIYFVAYMFSLFLYFYTSLLTVYIMTWTPWV